MILLNILGTLGGTIIAVILFAIVALILELWHEHIAIGTVVILIMCAWIGVGYMIGKWIGWVS